MMPELRSCTPGATLVGAPELWRGLSWFTFRGACTGGAEARICRGTPADGMDREGPAGTTWGKEMPEEVWTGDTGTS